MVWLPVFGIFNACTDVNARSCTCGLMDIVNESACKADSGRKIACCTRDLYQHQYCTLAFQSDTLPTELSYSLHGA